MKSLPLGPQRDQPTESVAPNTIQSEDADEGMAEDTAAGGTVGEAVPEEGMDIDLVHHEQDLRRVVSIRRPLG